MALDRKIGIILCSHVADGCREASSAFLSEPVEEGDSGWQVLCSAENREDCQVRIWSVEEYISKDKSFEDIVESAGPLSAIKRNGVWEIIG